jgi:hypothetical protein
VFCVRYEINLLRSRRKAAKIRQSVSLCRSIHLSALENRGMDFHGI